MESVADARACVFVIVIVRSAVPPALMVATEKALETTGLDGDTASVSLAKQVPPVHPAELVLVTLAGGVIDAVFVTWV